jgi:hypothetical protein
MGLIVFHASLNHLIPGLFFRVLEMIQDDFLARKFLLRRDGHKKWNHGRYMTRSLQYQRGRYPTILLQPLG